MYYKYLQYNIILCCQLMIVFEIYQDMHSIQYLSFLPLYLEKFEFHTQNILYKSNYLYVYL